VDIETGIRYVPELFNLRLQFGDGLLEIEEIMIHTVSRQITACTRILSANCVKTILGAFSMRGSASAICAFDPINPFQILQRDQQLMPRHDSPIFPQVHAGSRGTAMIAQGNLDLAMRQMGAQGSLETRGAIGRRSTVWPPFDPHTLCLVFRH